MLDINLIREKPEYVKEKLEERNTDTSLDKVLELDKEWRKLKKKTDDIRHKRNEVSEKINKSKKEGNEEKAERLIEEAKEISQELEEIEENMKELKQKRDKKLSRLPNLQHDSTPVGEEGNYDIVKEWGEKPEFEFEPKNHEEILESLNLLDMQKAAEITGSGFYLLKGELAELERALVNYMLDYHKNNGFIEINPPQLVKENTLFGTGQLPKFEEDLYKTEEGLYLIPTSEVPTGNIHSEDILKEDELPKKYVSFTQCFRTEAGQHGSKTPGIHRLHQFEKVEMFCYSHPDKSWELLEKITERAEKILEELGLHYRRITLPTADAAFASAKTYDIELYSPAMDEYIEVSSCSNCTGFQARRINAKYQDKEEGEMKYLHTLNGSGLATPRLIIALVETYQNEDGTINIPEVLQPYMNGKKKIKEL